MKSALEKQINWLRALANRFSFFLLKLLKGFDMQLTLSERIDGSGSWDKHSCNPDHNTNMKPGAPSGREDFFSSVDRDDKEHIAK